jgi:hypothetical protein
MLSPLLRVPGGGKFLVEFVDPAGSVNELYFTREKDGLLDISNFTRGYLPPSNNAVYWLGRMNASEGLASRRNLKTTILYSLDASFFV